MVGKNDSYATVMKKVFKGNTGKSFQLLMKKLEVLELKQFELSSKVDKILEHLEMDKNGTILNEFQKQYIAGFNEQYKLYAMEISSVLNMPNLMAVQDQESLIKAFGKEEKKQSAETFVDYDANDTSAEEEAMKIDTD